MKEIYGQIPLAELKNEPDPNARRAEDIIEIKEWKKIIDQVADKLTVREKEIIFAIFDGILDDKSFEEIARSLKVGHSRLYEVWNKVCEMKELVFLPQMLGELRDFVHGRLDLVQQANECAGMVQRLENVRNMLKKKMNRTPEEQDELEALSGILDHRYPMHMSVLEYPTGNYDQVAQRLVEKYGLNFLPVDKHLSDALARFRKTRPKAGRG